MSNAEELARLGKVLSVTTRIKMLELLKYGHWCVNALAQRLGITPAAASQHLRALREAGLVTAEKCGYFVHYCANAAALAKARQAVDRLLTLPEESADSASSCRRSACHSVSQTKGKEG